MLMRQALCDLLARSNDVPFLTLHHVEIAADYSAAKVYYSLLVETPSGLEKAEDYLRDNAPAIRHRLAAHLQMRSTPRLDFVYARGLREAERIDRVVRTIGEPAGE